LFSKDEDINSEAQLRETVQFIYEGYFWWPEKVGWRGDM
jgi:hypothetical protein